MDQVRKEVGLAQGQMTDSEVAKALVRQFFEAVIAHDYEKASVLFGGFPAEKLKGPFEAQRVREIISVGEPMPDDQSRKDVLRVPFSVKREDGGEWTGKAYVRPVFGQPGRWALDGGI